MAEVKYIKIGKKQYKKWNVILFFCFLIIVYILLTVFMLFNLKAFIGYKTPSAVTVPADGGDIRISYTPISYILKLGEQTKSLKYDEEYKLPSINKKGHTHEGFYFAS